MSGEEEQAISTPPEAPRSRGRPKGSKDAKPRAPRRAKQEAPLDAEEASGTEADMEPASEESASEESVPVAPAPVAPAPVAPRRARRPDTPREEDAPVAKPARRSACAPPRKVPARLERTPSPPLSYLEVMTSALTAARHAERTERSTRYDAFFAR
jgi:hypothetical protein